MTATLSTEQSYSEKKLAAWIRKFDRWMKAVEDYQSGARTDLPIRTMPSKNSKHVAYGYGHQISRAYGLDIHPMNVDDLRLIVALAAKARGC
jgi:hypothetical protein